MVAVPVELLRRAANNHLVMRRICNREAETGRIDASDPQMAEALERLAKTTADLQDALNAV
jgi:hypothetical protein